MSSASVHCRKESVLYVAEEKERWSYIIETQSKEVHTQCKLSVSDKDVEVAVVDGHVRFSSGTFTMAMVIQKADLSF